MLRRSLTLHLKPFSLALQPMTATNKAEHLSDDDRLMVAPKLNGVRCIAELRGGRPCFISESGKEFESCDRMAETLKPLYSHFPDLILDGELYAHQLQHRQLLSAVKARRNTATKAHKRIQQTLLQYCAFDMIRFEKFDCAETAFSQRFLQLQHLLKQSGVAPSPLTDSSIFDLPQGSVILLPHENSKKRDLEQLARDAASKGFPGLAIRVNDNKYQYGKRSGEFVCLTTPSEAEYEILWVEEAKGKGSVAGTAGTIFHRTEDGKIFPSRCHDADGSIWRRRKELVGRMATIQCELSPTRRGKPRSAIFKSVPGLATDKIE